jgi:ABC-type Fe3+/spermidine/putrescine transport system ATPase subunit
MTRATKPIALHGITARGLGPISITLPAGAYTCVLGPPGAGKTRLLGAIARDPGAAGLTKAEIAILPQGGPPPRLPKLDAALRQALAKRGVPSGQLDHRVAALLADWSVDAPTLDAASGLRARLALAFAAIPSLLLLDDPFAHTGDWTETADLLHDATRRCGLTVLHATPRREEAFALADRLILLDRGQLVQEGPLATLYERPASLAIAKRLGRANLLQGTILDIDNDVATVQLACGPVIEADPPAGPEPLPGTACIVLLRPERIAITSVAAADLGSTAIAAVLRDVTHRGDTLVLRAAIGTDTDLIVVRPAVAGAAGLVAGRTVSVAWQSQHALTFLA